MNELRDKYDIFLIDDCKNHHYLMDIPMTFQPEEFLIDHGFNWIYYYIIENPNFTKNKYMYLKDRLIKLNND